MRKRGQVRFFLFGGTGQTPLRVDPGYDNRNELTSLTRFSDVAGSTLVGTTVYSYDDSSRVTSIVNKNGSAATLSYYNYGYDSADRVTSETWQSGSTPGSRTYGYDNTNQLTSDSTATYTYDLTGNRTMTGYQTGTDNRLTTDGTFTYTYDSEGNLTQKSKGSSLETWYFSYDNRNHLTSVRQTSDGSTNLLLVTYTYDVFDQRATESKWKSGGSTVTTRFAYDGNQVWAELSTSNIVQTRYVFGDGQTQLFARIDVGVGLRWELTDRLGSVRDVLDATGATILDHLDYDGFGKPTETNATYGGRIAYAGYAYDRDAGLDQAGERYYAPAIARWLQQDPIVFQAGDPNLYRYVANDSTNATDPSGLQRRDFESQNEIQKRLVEFRKKGGFQSDWEGISEVVNGFLDKYKEELAVAVGAAMHYAAYRRGLRPPMQRPPRAPSKAQQPLPQVPNKPTLFPNKLPNQAIDIPRQVFTPDQVKKMPGRTLNYVVTEGGKPIIGRIDRGVGGGHIDLANGGPVQAAGEVVIRDGKIKSIDNASGHYEPKGPPAQQAAEGAFKKAGFEVDGKYIEKYYHPEKGWIPVGE